jgi:subtilisin family serine protease
MAHVARALRSSLVLILAAATATLSLAAPAAAASAPGDLLPGREVALPGALAPTDAYIHTADGRVQVLVELANMPAARAWAAALANPRGTKTQALASARAAAKATMAAIAYEQQTVAGMIAARSDWRATEVYRVGRALNAISYYVAPAAVDALRQLPGVRAVHLVAAEYPSNFTSVPFVGAPQLWGNTLSLPSNITGTGVRIGIIDTGIDYQHPMFGGSGLLADYKANDRVTISPSLFPTAKVVGGTDFAGDAYTGANSPVPDPNPTDCNDHGSHVAGTAAGFGVQSDGTTYPGPYSPSTPFNSLRIGNGVAPSTLLYSLRVFGYKG